MIPGETTRPSTSITTHEPDRGKHAAETALATSPSAMSAIDSGVGTIAS